MEENIKKIKSMIRDVADFPKKGILFRDITTALKDAETLKIMVDELYEIFKDEKIDYIAGIESRGFIFGMPLAYILGKSFVLIRKKGKLPCETISESYDLEYGKAEIEIHTDSIKPGQKVVLVDDLIATGTYFNGTTAKSVNTRYASDQGWADKVFNYMQYLYNKL